MIDVGCLRAAHDAQWMVVQMPKAQLAPLCIVPTARRTATLRIVDTLSLNLPCPFMDTALALRH
ncbi:hypothetical protein [Mesorhizobium sp. SP-1A]|uniref:hypothetical protein n=1 Tax=Mesorhizobium sp. SP-1A TaxID=3077840 RepID=UPI0028F6D45D|nr:hypothetical protein [Mesorhizobium sp. SP-1A]